MNFRFKLFRLHLAASTTVLSIVLAGFYFGWYRWPGWYLAVVTPVIVVMAGVDLALGPLLTLIIANPAKTRRTLARDLSIIAAMQLFALGYGSVQLWNGRPLYYVFSRGILQLVQAYDLDPQDAKRARANAAQFAPHWYSLPRWVWAPGPANSAPSTPSASTEAADYSTMPSYFRPWEAGLVELRTKLQPIDESGFFIFNEKSALSARMREAGLHPEQHNTMPMTGRGRPVLVVFDWSTVNLQAILKPF